MASLRCFSSSPDTVDRSNLQEINFQDREPAFGANDSASIDEASVERHKEITLSNDTSSPLGPNFNFAIAKISVKQLCKC
jgi:hypothetical protein